MSIPADKRAKVCTKLSEGYAASANCRLKNFDTPGTRKELRVKLSVSYGSSLLVSFVGRIGGSPRSYVCQVLILCMPSPFRQWLSKQWPVLPTRGVSET
jgi:hypothetical protein